MSVEQGASVARMPEGRGEDAANVGTGEQEGGVPDNNEMSDWDGDGDSDDDEESMGGGNAAEASDQGDDADKDQAAGSSSRAQHSPAQPRAAHLSLPRV